MRKIFSVFVFIFSFVGKFYSLELTLKDCINLTFDNNPILKSKLSDLKQQEYSYLSSINSYLPKISISNNFSKSGGEGRDVSNSFSASVSLSQNIFDYDSISSIKTSKLSYDVAKYNYESYLIELRKNLYNSFFTLFFEQENLKVNEKIVEIRKNNADLITLKYKSGFESKGNMLYSVAQYEMAKLNLEKSKRQIKIASNNLKNIMGVNIDDDIVVKYDIKNIEELDFSLNDIKKYIKENPNYKIYEKNIEIAEEKLKSSKYDYLPKLSFSASESWSGSSRFANKNSWNIGLTLSFGLFSSGITYYKNNLNTLKESLKSVKEKFNDYLISIENDIKNAYEDYLNALSTLNTYRILLEANEERYKEAQIKYMAGKMSYIDLENIERNLIDSKQNYIECIKNVYIKKVSLENLIGIKLDKSL